MAQAKPGGPLGLESRAINNTNQSAIVCYAPTMITTNGIWQGDNPLDFSLPLFILQVALVVLTTRALVLILKPFRQPRVIAEILGGVVLGPSVMGQIPHFAETVFPMRSMTVLETMAHLGLLYFLFLVGVEMDVGMIKRTGRKALVVAMAGMVLPFVIGTSTSFFLRHNIAKNVNEGAFFLFLGVALSVTAFPILARILAELKLLNSEIGRIAMSSALVNDMCAWILLALAIALADSHGTILAALWVVLCAVAFVVICFYVIRPGIWWIVQRTPEGEPVDDLYVCIILTGVMVCGLITDVIGIHSIFGAFVFGLVIPNGPLGMALLEKLEDFVSGLLLPLFFAISGLRTNFTAINDPTTAGFLILVIVLASAAKVAGTVVVAVFYTMPFRDGFSLGLLMNTKGLIEMIVLNIGRDKEVLDEQSFALMVITSVIMTAIVTPVVTSVYKPGRRFLSYKRRTIQRSKPDSELRMLACVHTSRNVPTIISLLEVSHPTKRAPIFVYALHLVELTGRASAMLIVHNASRKPGEQRPRNLNRTQAQSEHIINAFETYEQHASGVSVQPLTAISPYSTMHEDVCNLAEDKRVALIILPFHKQQTVDGGMEATNPAIRTVNQNVLANAPCSVGILVDRGLGGTARIAPGQQHTTHHIALLFFGGPDDREALAYAWRMAEHPGISLTVLRFLPPDGTQATTQSPSANPAVGPQDATVIMVATDNDRERQLDDDYIGDFRLKSMNDASVVYMEKVVSNGEETVSAIRSMDSIHDLYIVGRGQGVASPLTSGLTDWSECPELGPIGDLLASSDFAATVSVLVVQQYVGEALAAGEGTLGVSDTHGQEVQQYLNNADHRARTMGGTR